MRLTAVLTILRILKVVALNTTSTIGTKNGMLGFALGSKNPDGSCKSTSDYEEDFDAIKSNTNSTLVRGYSASDCSFCQQILPAAQTKGFQVVIGVWPDTDESFLADKVALWKYATRYPQQVYGITVGSETLYRGNFSGRQLLEKINDVKALMPPNTKVGTADSWNKFADGTADAIIRGGVDLLMANAFPYWPGKEAGLDAELTYFTDIQKTLARIREVAGSLDNIEFWNGETGWPTDGGTSYDQAEAGTENAATFYQQAVCAMLEWGINVFYFEAFDEIWKPVSIGQNGLAADETHWGAMTAERETKPGFELLCQT